MHNQTKRRSIRPTKRRILYTSGIGADGSWGEDGVIANTISPDQVSYKAFKSKHNEGGDVGYESDQSVLITGDPVLYTPTQSESMRLGYDSNATVLMTESPGLDTITESEVRSLRYNWDEELKMTGDIDEVLDKYAQNDEPRIERNLLENVAGEGTMVSTRG